MADLYEKKILAELIKRQRKKLSLIQEELAEKIDLSTQHLSKVENGHSIPSLETFLKLMQVLNIDLNLINPDIQLYKDERRTEIIRYIKTAADSEIKFILDILETTLSYKNSFRT